MPEAITHFREAWLVAAGFRHRRSSTSPRRSSTRATWRGAEAVGAEGSHPQARAESGAPRPLRAGRRLQPPGADRRGRARGEPRPGGWSRAGEGPSVTRGRGRDRTGASGRLGLRVPRGNEAARRPASRARDHRHAARGPPRVLRQHDRGDPPPRRASRRRVRMAREDATVHVPLTRPSHVTIFTGPLSGRDTACATTSRPVLAADVPLLAEVLQQAGFATGGLRLVDRGLPTVRAGPRVRHLLGPLPGGGRRRAVPGPRSRGAATHRPRRPSPGWKPDRSGRLFVWLHLYDPHDPYEPPEPYASRYSRAALRRRGGLVGRACRPAGRTLSTRLGLRRGHAARRDLRPRRGPRGAR